MPVRRHARHILLYIYKLDHEHKTGKIKRIFICGEKEQFLKIKLEYIEANSLNKSVNSYQHRTPVQQNITRL